MPREAPVTSAVFPCSRSRHVRLPSVAWNDRGPGSSRTGITALPTARRTKTDRAATASTASAGAPSPAAPRAARGRGEFGSASTASRCAARAPPRPLPPNCWERGELRCRWMHGAVTRASRLRPAAAPSPPAPLPRTARGEGRTRSRSEGRRASLPEPPCTLGWRHPPPRSLRGRAGDGGRLTISHATVRLAAIPAPHQPPPAFFGARCEPERAEGAPRTQPGDLRIRCPLSRCRGAPAAGTPRGCPGRPGTRPSWRW